MTMAGRFGTGSSLDATPLDTGDTYVITAILDITTDLQPSLPGRGFFPATSVTINVNGTDYAASDPLGQGLLAELRDPDAAGNVDDEYMFFFGTHNTTTDFHREAMADIWDTATPPFDGDAPTPSILSNFDRIAIGAPLVISLAGAGNLTFVGSDRIATAGTLDQFVPEPSAFALIAIGAVGLLPTRRLRIPSAGVK